VAGDAVGWAGRGFGLEVDGALGQQVEYDGLAVADRRIVARVRTVDAPALAVAIEPGIAVGGHNQADLAVGMTVIGPLEVAILDDVDRHVVHLGGGLDGPAVAQAVVLVLGQPAFRDAGLARRLDVVVGPGAWAEVAVELGLQLLVERLAGDGTGDLPHQRIELFAAHARRPPRSGVATRRDSAIKL